MAEPTNSVHFVRDQYDHLKKLVDQAGWRSEVLASLDAHRTGTHYLRDAYRELLDSTSKLATYSGGAGSISGALNEKSDRIKDELAETRKQLEKLSQNAQKSNEDLETEKRLRSEAETKLQELIRINDRKHLITRVNIDAGRVIADSDDLHKKFEDGEPHLAYVLSIDIRRSTELMLKAVSASLFADFLNRLAEKLHNAVTRRQGVFDKFTGDGILAFFPEFFSGPDAGYLAATAASECHKLFEEHYRENEECFSSVLLDVGLGIGLDYGPVHVVKVVGEITVVGRPVVYACRMGGATAGQTFANQPAKQELLRQYPDHFDFEPAELTLKHEGRTRAWRLTSRIKSSDVRAPGWEAFAKKEGDDTPAAITPEADSGTTTLNSKPTPTPKPELKQKAAPEK